MLITLAALWIQATKTSHPRFEQAGPLTGIEPVMIDSYQNRQTHAGQLARAFNLQGRVMWIDCTANIERYNTTERVEETVSKIADAGFNTIVFDVKPIAGLVVYNSAIAPKLTGWRGKSLDLAFDALKSVSEAARRHRLQIFASLNAFSEGHSLLKVGPGYEKLDQQTIIYDPQPVLRFGSETAALNAKVNTFGGSGVSVCTTSEAIPRIDESAFAVTISRDQIVLDGFEGGGLGPGIPTIPRGGVAVVAAGPAADWLRKNATPGTHAGFETTPAFRPISEMPDPQYPLMMNPFHPTVWEYELSIAKEVVSKYDVDGIIYDDRLRFAGMNADFSPQARAEFEKSHTLKRWPEDIFRYTITPTLQRGIEPGPLFDEWMKFRANRVSQFVQTVRSEIRRIRPSVQLGVYAGSWYGEYPALANNYASVDAESAFWFATPAYRETGFASRLDFLITGCYYPNATVFEAMTKGQSIGSTVEAAGILTNRLVKDQCWCYAGIALSDFRDNPTGLGNALQAACASTQGVMVFDLSHDVEPMWPLFKRAFLQPKFAPSRRPDILTLARTRRAAQTRAGIADPPIPLAAGSLGTGQ